MNDILTLHLHVLHLLAPELLPFTASSTTSRSRKWWLYSLDLLVVFMAFSDDLLIMSPSSALLDRVKDRFPSVRDHDILSVRLCKTNFDIFDDVLILLKPRVVGRDDAEIRHLSADLAHGISAVPRHGFRRSRRRRRDASDDNPGVLRAGFPC